MNEYVIIYNRSCFYWAVLHKGKEVHGATTKQAAENWASKH